MKTEPFPKIKIHIHFTKSPKSDNILKYYIIRHTHIQNHNLPCPKGEVYDLTVCIVVNEENTKSCSDVDLDQTIINVKLIQAFTIYSNFRLLE